jgi:hypothetical protein
MSLDGTSVAPSAPTIENQVLVLKSGLLQWDVLDLADLGSVSVDLDTQVTGTLNVDNIDAGPDGTFLYTQNPSDVTWIAMSFSLMSDIDPAWSPSGNDVIVYNVGGGYWESTTLVASQIPFLDASKITSGTFAAARIPNLDASKITTGILEEARGGWGLDLSAVGQGSVYHGTIGGGTLTELTHPADGGTYYLRASGTGGAADVAWATYAGLSGGSSGYMPYWTSASALGNTKLQRVSDYVYAWEVDTLTLDDNGVGLRTLIVRNTADTADNQVTHIGGGGDILTSRGAYVSMYGNEHGSNPGDLYLAAGSTGDVFILGTSISYSIRPSTDETYALGTPSFRWSTTYTKFLNVESTSTMADITMSGTLTAANASFSTITAGTWNGSVIGLAYGGFGQNVSGVGQMSLYHGQVGGGGFTELTHPADGSTYFLRAQGTGGAADLAWASMGTLSGGDTGYIPYWTSATALGSTKFRRVDDSTIYFEGSFFGLEGDEVGSCNFEMYVYGSDNYIKGYAASGTKTTPTATVGKGLLFMRGYGYNGTTWAEGARISILASGTWSGSHEAAYIDFYTTPNASTVLTHQWRLSTEGHWQPAVDNAVDLGNSTLGVRNLYQTTGRIGNIRSDSRHCFIFEGNNVTTGYALLADSAVTYLNAPTSLNFRIANTEKLVITAGLLNFGTAATFASTLGVTGVATFSANINAESDIKLTGSIYSNVATSYSIISGGSSTNLGSNLVLYGESHAAADDWAIRRDVENIVHFDASGNTMYLGSGSTAMTVAIRASSNPILYWRENTTNRALIDYQTTGNYLRIEPTEAGSYIRLRAVATTVMDLTSSLITCYKNVKVNGQTYPDDMYYPAGQQNQTGSKSCAWANGNVTAWSMGASSLTLNVDSSSNMNEGGTYFLVVYGPAAASQTLTISGVDSWIGSNYGSGVSIAAGDVVAITLIKIRNRADDADWVIGTTVVDNETIPV